MWSIEIKNVLQKSYDSVLNTEKYFPIIKIDFIARSGYDNFFFSPEALKIKPNLFHFKNTSTVFVLITALCAYTQVQPDRALQELSNGSLGMKIGQLLGKLRPFQYPGWLIRVPKSGVCANQSMCANQNEYGTLITLNDANLIFLIWFTL